MTTNKKTPIKYGKIGKVRASGFSFETTPAWDKKFKNYKNPIDIGQLTLDALRKHKLTLKD